jgi:hypothetical protein
MPTNLPLDLPALKATIRNLLKKERKKLKTTPRRNMLPRTVSRYLKKITTSTHKIPTEAVESNIGRRKGMRKSLRREGAKGIRKAARATSISQRTSLKIMIKEGTPTSKETKTDAINDY